LAHAFSRLFAPKKNKQQALIASVFVALSFHASVLKGCVSVQEIGRRLVGGSQEYCAA
jgi:hypothetical protein